MMQPPSLSLSTAATTTKTAKTAGTPCCVKIGLKRGPWTPEEDELLANYIKREGEGRWRTLPKKAGLLRCGKSCRLRWMNYLRPSVKRGHITLDEEDLILRLHRLLGNRWSLIAGRIPGRTDNEIKNYWNTHMSKKLISQGIDPRTHKPLIINPDSSFHDNNTKPSSSSKQNHDHQNLDRVPFEDAAHISGGDNSDEVLAAAAGDDVYTPGTVNAASGMMVDDGLMIGNNIDGEEEDDGINKYCNIDDYDDDDNAFSSFLDSLINEDVYDSQLVSSAMPGFAFGGADGCDANSIIASPPTYAHIQHEDDLPSLNERVED